MDQGETAKVPGCEGAGHCLPFLVEKRANVRYTHNNSNVPQTTTSVKTVGPRRGRPRKFSAPSRAVTLTLPEHVIEALATVDSDLSRAIVRLTQPEIAKQPHPPAELSPFGQRAVIVVNPTRTLEERTGVNLVPLPDGRALMSFDSSQTPAGFELMIDDALEDKRLSRADREIFKAVSELLRDARRSKTVTLRQHHIIVLESRRRRRTGRTTSQPNQEDRS